MAKLPNLTKLSLDELKQLQKETVQAIASFEARKRAEAIAELDKVAAKHGYKLKELVGKKPGNAKPQGVAKYVHPENPANTWTGKGRQPAWIKAGLEAGKSLDDFAI